MYICKELFGSGMIAIEVTCSDLLHSLPYEPIRLSGELNGL